jgi:alpha-N-arabinofuranosidase
MVKKKRKISLALLPLIAVFAAGIVSDAQSINGREYHVSLKGNDGNPGSVSEPLRTIQAAAMLAQPGDTVTVHEGIYRELVNPPRGGESDTKRIVYRAALEEKVAIKGSEVIKEWKRQEGDVWMVHFSNDYFGAFNPYANLIVADWFFPLGREHHTGAVYINDFALNEAATLEELFGQGRGNKWFGESDNTGTRIWANFQGADPNKELVEINKRRTVFYPSKPGINYITVRGFTLSQAATPWSPPTTEQIGLIGTNWSKGWIIENNTITHSRCTGITLGKYFDRLDGLNRYGYNAHYQTVKRVLERGDWTPENIGHHIVRNNYIAFCEQSGLVGSHGAAFSTITGNVIHDIHVRRLFDGFEQAGIKIHAPVDTTISNNLIFNCFKGIWLDWMSQGARVTANLLYGNYEEDLFLEVNHGPLLVDNNILLSDVALKDASQGSAYVHNLFAGAIIQRPELERVTQYFQPHLTELVGVAKILDGDDRFYNNIIVEESGLKSYDKSKEPLWMGGNLFLAKAKACRIEKNPLFDEEADTRFHVRRDGKNVYLEMDLDQAWGDARQRKLITTELLGETRVTKQAFENTDGSPLVIDTDYFGNPRDPENPFPGPFELLEKTGRIKVWPSLKLGADLDHVPTKQ